MIHIDHRKPPPPGGFFWGGVELGCSIICYLNPDRDSKIMGLKGSNDDYLDVELEDHRRRLLEALNTFHTFDEDGGGTIDALEIKTTMRAMGQKVCKR